MSVPLRAAVVVHLAIALLAGPALAAAGASSLEVVDVDTSRYPAVSVTVSAPRSVTGGAASTEGFRVLEGDAPRDAEVTVVGGDDLEVVVVVDTSGSMAGAPMEAAKQASETFITSLPGEVPVAVVGFGSEARELSAFSTDRSAAVATVRGLVARGETALYDAVELALGQFTDGADRRRAIVLLSDGGDTASATTLDAVRQLLVATPVSLFSIALATGESDVDALEELSATGTGRVVPGTELDALAGVYAAIASELVDRYRIEYRSEAHGSTELEVVHTGDAGESVAVVPLVLPAPPPEPVVRPAAPVPTVIVSPGLLGEPWVLWGSLAAVFCGLAVLLSTVMAPGRSRVRLAAGRESRGAGGRSRERSPRLGAALNRATVFADEKIRVHRWGRGLNTLLEQAGIDLRPGEFLVLWVGAVLGSAAAGGLFGGLPLAILLAIVAVVVVRSYLTMRRGRRRRRFAEQLSDVLQLLSGSLRAGYGLLQAVDAVAREADDPAAGEFRRVLMETRIGRDLDAALDAMAERLDNQDFQWVVQAIQIHREVGGDLAEVLEAVAGTIRERDRIRRQVKALSAEGKLSAIILLALPFGVAFMLFITNPGYLAELTASVAGWALLGAAGFLMLVGALWMRRITRLVF